MTLRGRRQVNFGSCSYLGLETDLRLKTAACDAVARYGVQFASSRAYVSCPPYAELERLLAALFETPAGRRADDHAGALRRAADPRSGRTTRSSATSWFTTACRRCCRRCRPRGRPAASSDTAGSIGWTEMVGTLGQRHRRVWYLADGVYSMHGDPAPLAALAEI